MSRDNRLSKPMIDMIKHNYAAYLYIIVEHYQDSGTTFWTCKQKTEKFEWLQ